RPGAGRGARGFANGGLRNISGRSGDEWIAEVAPDPETDRLGYLAVAYAHPPWIVRAFAEALGEDPEELLAADNQPAPVHLCARPGRIDAAALAAETGGEQGRYSPFAVYLPSG